MVCFSRSDRGLLAVDPMDLDNGIEKIEVAKGDYTPLPSVFPEHPTERWEHKEGAHVLSLWNRNEETDDEDKADWTSEFFPGTVVRPPCKREHEKLRGYLIRFHEEGKESERIVPEKFVVSVQFPF
jgi:hypothetical protein